MAMTLLSMPEFAEMNKALLAAALLCACKACTGCDGALESTLPISRQQDSWEQTLHRACGPPVPQALLGGALADMAL
eukprot:scaffold144174_cov20-Tisochrysis_lutea.AAC.2